MNRAFKIAGFAACLVAVVVMSGGHWLALQSVAWGRMIADFSQQDSIGTAIAKTFSGKHPCSMCLKIRKGWHEEKQREEKSPWLKTEEMPEALWELRCVTVPAAPTVARCERPFVPACYSDFTDSPPTPPPRACFPVLELGCPASPRQPEALALAR
jgi:hypothetical protein